MRVLALEPYYGGSHKAFLDQWIQQSRHQWTLLTLPARKWKWRMHHAPITFVQQIHNHIQSCQSSPAHTQNWDVLFCSDMLNLALWRGLCPPTLRTLPTFLYFHENQLTYPTKPGEKRDLHYGFQNIISAAAADVVCFNSEFHRNDFITAAKHLLAKMPDFAPMHLIDEIRKHAIIRYPAISIPSITDDNINGYDIAKKHPTPRPMRIIWVSRWEHDKNPEDFFAALFTLQEMQIPFRLTVLGEQFRQSPAIFDQAKLRLSEHIDHWGYVDNQATYWQHLAEADIVVSTANHEFFGIAVLEAIAAGAYPILPNRVAYPEIIEILTSQIPELNQSDFIYKGDRDSLISKLLDCNNAIQRQKSGLWQNASPSALAIHAKHTFGTKSTAINKLDDAIELTPK